MVYKWRRREETDEDSETGRDTPLDSKDEKYRKAIEKELNGEHITELKEELAELRNLIKRDAMHEMKVKKGLVSITT